jgi:hypothetical protein
MLLRRAFRIFALRSLTKVSHQGHSTRARVKVTRQGHPAWFLHQKDLRQREMLHGGSRRKTSCGFPHAGCALLALRTQHTGAHTWLCSKTRITQEVRWVHGGFCMLARLPCAQSGLQAPGSRHNCAVAYAWLCSKTRRTQEVRWVHGGSCMLARLPCAQSGLRASGRCHNSEVAHA